jgi:hypothetical protein
VEVIVVENDPEADAEARAFRHDNVERAVAARHDLPDDTLVLRGDLQTPAELADLVLQAIQDREEPDNRLRRSGAEV